MDNIDIVVCEWSFVLLIMFGYPFIAGMDCRQHGISAFIVISQFVGRALINRQVHLVPVVLL